ncbi:MAG: hypothetical protein H0Z34_04450 [Brevibacillus sp.]|nr:hypothetical protein [Brevibacillus sp.]
MVIRPQQLWWLLPIMLSLFLLGGLIAHWTDESTAHEEGSQQEQPVDPAEQMREQRKEIAALIQQWETNANRSFQVDVGEKQFRGTLQGKSFQLSGDVGGHQVTVQREGDALALTVDGEPKEPLLLPFALYTPYDHLMLIKGELQSIVPIVLHRAEGEGLSGYQFTLPAEEVKAMLALWLGPGFPADEVMDQSLRDVSLTYQMWYEQRSLTLRRLLVTLKVVSPSGQKVDQLLFRM